MSYHFYTVCFTFIEFWLIIFLLSFTLPVMIDKIIVKPKIRIDFNVFLVGLSILLLVLLAIFSKKLHNITILLQVVIIFAYTITISIVSGLVLFAKDLTVEKHNRIEKVHLSIVFVMMLIFAIFMLMKIGVSIWEIKVGIIAAIFLIAYLLLRIKKLLKHIDYFVFILMLMVVMSAKFISCVEVILAKYTASNSIVIIKYCFDSIWAYFYCTVCISAQMLALGSYGGDKRFTIWDFLTEHRYPFTRKKF